MVMKSQVREFLERHDEEVACLLEFLFNVRAVDKHRHSRRVPFHSVPSKPNLGL